MDLHVKWEECVYLIKVFHDNMNYETNVTKLIDEIKACLDNMYLHYEQ